MKEYNPETHVCIPKAELAKLEQSRIDLYKFFENEGLFDQVSLKTYQIHSITQTIWEVANRLKWD